MTSRQRKALLAYLKRVYVRIGEGHWIVKRRPTRKGKKHLPYMLTLEDGRWQCTCPAYEETGDCKHVAGLLLRIERGAPQQPYDHIDDSKRPYYPQDNVRDRVVAQIMLPALPHVIHDLADSIFPVTGKRERHRPRTEMRDLILCISLRAVHRRGGSHVQAFVEEAFAKKLLYRRPIFRPSAPSEEAITSNMRQERTYDAFQRMIEATNSPFLGRVAAIAIDGSEFNVPNRKIGAELTEHEAKWADKDDPKRFLSTLTVKLHAAVDVNTGMFVAAVVTPGKSNEQLQSKTLVETSRKVRFVHLVLADRGYVSGPFFEYLKQNGIEWEIPTKSNIKEEGDGILAEYARDWNSRSEERKERYGLRQWAEGAFSRLKRLIGENLRSRTLGAQRSELLAQVFVANVMWLIRCYVYDEIDLPFLKNRSRAMLDRARDAVKDHPKVDRTPRPRDGMKDEDAA